MDEYTRAGFILSHFLEPLTREFVRVCGLTSNDIVKHGKEVPGIFTVHRHSLDKYKFREVKN